MVDTAAAVNATGLRVRPVDVDGDELQRWLDILELVFRHTPSAHPDGAAFRRPVLRTQRVSAAVDQNDEIVATFRSWDTTLTVPGGSIAADAVSSVTVHPTHRRRGALTAMMTADLEDAVAREVAVAILIASEAGIYGRFGFGPATQCVTWEVDLPAARLRPGLRRAGSVEVVPEARLREHAPAVYQQARRPGAIDRLGFWWDRVLGVVEVPGEPHPPRAGVLFRDDAGAVRGYALWSAKEDWTDRLSSTRVTVHELEALTDEAYIRLWGHLLEIDLVAGIRAEGRAVDEALPWLVDDGRRVRATSTADFLWTRLLDPATALSARTYATPSSTIAFEVVDPAGWAAGSYLLEVDALGRGTCTRTTTSAQVTLDVTALSSAWLGGGDLTACRVAGAVVEHVPGALDRLTTLLRTPQAPWTSTWF